MGWNLRTISVTMLVVIALLPLSGTLCAVTCLAAHSDLIAHAESAGHQHGAGQDAHTPAASDVTAISGPSAHACDHDAAFQQTTTAAERAQPGISAPPATFAVTDGAAAMLLQRSRRAPGAPPGTSPSTSTPLVLRV